LINICKLAVHNDFHDSHGIFSLFDGLEVPDLDETLEISESLEEEEEEETHAISNEKPTTNGTSKTNGVPAAATPAVGTTQPEVAN